MNENTLQLWRLLAGIVHDTCVFRMYQELLADKNFTHDRLLSLIELQDAGSLIAAAKGDSGRQSRLSHQLKELGEFFGVKLTERAGRTVRLSSDGERLVLIARTFFKDICAFKLIQQGSSPAIRIGAGNSLLQWLVIPALASIRTRHPLARFSLHDLESHDIVARLNDDRLEFGIAPRDTIPPDLKSRPAVSVKHVVIVPDRVGRRRGMNTVRHALLECPHVALSGSTSIRRSIDNMAQGLGGKYQPVLECDSISECVAAIRTEQFAGVIPSWAWEPELSARHAVIEDPSLEQLDEDLVLAWHPRVMKSGRDTALLAKSLAEAVTLIRS